MIRYVRLWLKRTQRSRRAPARFRPQVEGLEDRLTPTTTMSPEEQLMLELINRARANPTAEAARYGINLNEGLAAGTISTAAKQPLAPNQLLLNSVQGHLNYLLSNRLPLSHTGAGGSDPFERMIAAGYSYTNAGENLAFIQQGGSLDLAATVVRMHELLFVDAGISGRGHRTNLLQPAFKEAGSGLVAGSFPLNGFPATAVYSGQDFGARAGNSFLTGVAFTDAVVNDDFYTVGEGIGGVVITATNVSTGAVFTATTGAAGGYALQLAPGTYTITASGATPLAGSNTVTIGSQNVKFDFGPSPLAAAIYQSFTGDFNGDGRDDVAGFTVNGHWLVGLAGSNSTFTSSPWAQWSIPLTWHRLFVGDFNGDGRDDVAGMSTGGNWFVGLSNGNGQFVTSAAWAQWSIPVVWHQLFVGNFNGDSRDDIAGMATNGTWWVGLSNGSGQFVTSASWATWSIPVTWHRLFTGDFNADNRDDIAGMATNGTWWVGLSNGSNRFTTSASWAAWSAPYVWHELFIGDFNADGRDDVAGFAFNGTWWVGLSNGSSSFSLPAAPWSSWSIPSSWHQLFVGDFNNDGRADVAGFGVNGQWWLGLSNGTTRFTVAAAPWATWATPPSWLAFEVGDFNNDGRADVAGFNVARSWWVGRSTGSQFVSEQWGLWT